MAGLCLVSWLLVRPRYKPASRNELLVLIPPELSVNDVTNPLEVTRFHRFVDLLALVEGGRTMIDLDPRSLTVGRSEIAQKFCRNPELWAIDRILTEGPMQFDPVYVHRPFYKDVSYYTHLNSLYDAAVYAARQLLNDHDDANALKVIGLANRLLEKTEPLGDSLIAKQIMPMRSLLVDTVLEWITLHHLTLDFCRQLLQSTPPAPTEDFALESFLKWDLKDVTVEVLRDPVLWSNTHPTTDEPGIFTRRILPDPLIGSFDPIATMKKVVGTRLIQYRNAKSIYAKYDPVVDQKAMDSLSKLPSETLLHSFNRITYTAYSTQKALKAVSSLASDSHYIENWILSKDYFSKPMIEYYLRQRTRQDLCRVLLAQRIYCYTHGGQYASRKELLVPILRSAWPTDLFDGKPLRYAPTKRVVYSVGQNLIDDGGMFSGSKGSNLDVGVSLQFK